MSLTRARVAVLLACCALVALAVLSRPRLVTVPAPPVGRFTAQPVTAPTPSVAEPRGACPRQRRHTPVPALDPRPPPPPPPPLLAWSAPSSPNVDLAAAEAFFLAGTSFPAALSARLKALSVAEVLRNPQFRPAAGAAPWCPYTNPEVVATFPTTSRVFGPGTVTVVAYNPIFPGAEHLAVYDVMLAAAGGAACVAVDAGANMGTIATYLASRGCRVVAYEAALWNYRNILSAVRAAGQLERVTVLLGALSDSCGEAVSILEWEMDKQDGQHLAFIASGGQSVSLSLRALVLILYSRLGKTHQHTRRPQEELSGGAHAAH